MIKVEKLNQIYNAGTALEVYALRDVSFEVNDEEFVGIIGRTGCGKSTLIQHLNGLIKATSGNIYFDGKNIYDKGYNMNELRHKVGLVFQYPEYQLFEEDIIRDVAFGPKNMGLDNKEAMDRAKEALSLVGIDESLYKKSPFEISGGQKRRVAIAGVLAMKPEVLVLDEPTAGLDPQGRDEILGEIKKIHEEYKTTVILVSHSMDDVAEYTDRVIALSSGEVKFDGTPREVFTHEKELKEIGLDVPQATKIANDLRAAGYKIPEDVILIDEIADSLKAQK